MNSTDKVIESVTYVIKGMVDVFLNSPSPCLYLDASFYCNYFTMLVAVFTDANHHVQPMACHLCGEESGDDYIMLLQSMVDAGMSKKDHIVVVSDHHASIHRAVIDALSQTSIPYRHIACAEHLKRIIADLVNNDSDSVSQDYMDIRSYLWRAQHNGTKELCEKYLKVNV